MGLLELRELSKEYRRGGRTFNAVNRVNLSVEPGDFISIIGRSGSGKTTLLNMGAGLLNPTGGSVFFEGSDIYALRDRDISFLRNEKIGYVPRGKASFQTLPCSTMCVFPGFCSAVSGMWKEGRSSCLRRWG